MLNKPVPIQASGHAMLKTLFPTRALKLSWLVTARATNESIRQNFKPKPRKKRTVQQTADGPKFMGADIERELQQILTGSHPMLKS